VVETGEGCSGNRVSQGIALKKNVTISVLGLLSRCGWETPGGEHEERDRHAGTFEEHRSGSGNALQCLRAGFCDVLGTPNQDGTERGFARDRIDAASSSPCRSRTAGSSGQGVSGSCLERADCVFGRGHSGQCSCVGALTQARAQSPARLSVTLYAADSIGGGDLPLLLFGRIGCELRALPHG
jgi:hypothetical protein